jgi:signal transduction histidine kinase
VVDVNPSAQRILGLPAEQARGRLAHEVLPSFPGASAWPEPSEVVQSEIGLVTDGAPRRYAVRVSTLQRHGGFALGYLVVLYDVTDQREAQAREIEQQRALATLQERDRVARELHDGLGQVLGYAKMQAQAARGLLALQEWTKADEHLAQLVAVAQDAHADVREYILGSRAGDAAELELLPSLEEYLRRFRTTYGIAVNLEVAPELAALAIEPMAGAQLLRILQESLTNVRKHAQARSVRIGLAACDGRAEVVVEDDGRGFDPGQLEFAEANTFGLRFMRERASEVGGTVEVRPVPGQGTRVVISVPLGGRQP